MGCTLSSRVRTEEYFQAFLAFERQRVFDEIGLSDVDVNKLYKVFQKLDIDRSGSVELSELIVMLGIDDSAYTRRVFQLFDSDGSSKFQSLIVFDLLGMEITTLIILSRQPSCLSYCMKYHMTEDIQISL